MTDSALPSGENKSFVILISCIATIGGFLFGFDSGVINGTVDGLVTSFGVTKTAVGVHVAFMLLGCAVGAAAAGRLADLYGRRAMLIVAAILFIVSAWGSGVATGIVEFDIYRLLGGLAVGAASVMAPAYISEVAPARYRGRLTTIQQVAIISGLTAAFLSNYVLAHTAGSSLEPFWMGIATWRWMFWIEIAPAAIFFFALMVIPESPRFLVASGKKDKALAVLTKLYGAQAAPGKVAEIDSSLDHDHKPRLSDLISKVTGKVRPIVWVGIGLATFQQLVGINVIFYYGSILWQSVGFSEDHALLINVVSGAVSIGAVVLSLVLVDKIGRKPLLWIGSAGMAVTLTLTAIAFATGTLDANGDLQLSDNMGILALVAANVYVIFFNMSWGPVMWVMLGEMFPNQIRGSGLAVAGLFQWGSNWAITMSFPALLAGLGLAVTYGFYALCAFISIIFVIKYVNETNGVELEDMEG